MFLRSRTLLSIVFMLTATCLVSLTQAADESGKIDWTATSKSVTTIRSGQSSRGIARAVINPPNPVAST